MAQAVRSPRVRAFVQEYVWGEHAGNGAKCALAAGFCQKTHSQARRYAYTLLRQENVKALVDKESAEKARQLKQKAVRVAEVTYERGVVDPLNAFDAQGEPLALHLMPQDLRRAVQSVKIEYVEREVVNEDGSPAISDTGKSVVLRVAKVVELKLHDTRPDRELFLKYAGELKEKVEIGDPNGDPIKIVFNLSPPKP